MNRRELLKTAVAGALSAVPFGAVAIAGQRHTGSLTLNNFPRSGSAYRQFWTCTIQVAPICNGRKLGNVDVSFVMRLECKNGIATLCTTPYNAPSPELEGEWIEVATGPIDEMTEAIKGSAIGERYGT